MVHNCAIISCPLHNRRNIRKGLLFHSFPVDQHRFDLWRQTVFNHCSKTISINKHSKICYRHFHPDDYIANHTGLTRYLKATAVPSIFNQTQSNTNLIASSTFYNHLLTSSATNTNHRSMPETSSSLSILPASLSNMSNTKTKRLLTTIDKLHQIQHANKIGQTQKSNISDDTSIKQEDSGDIDDKNDDTTTETLNDNNLVLNKPFVIDHQSIAKDLQPIQDTSLQNSSIESETRRWTDNSVVTLPKTHSENILFKFLEQANLLQYYSAFIEQGGDDLKQLAEAQNDDFQEIVTLVGMISKPLHVKRFKKALIDYRLSVSNVGMDHSILPVHRLSTDEALVNRNSKFLSTLSSNWCLNKIDSCKNNNSHQLLDDNQRKMIADEAERLANLLPVTSLKKFNGRNNFCKDLVATMNLPRDFEDRWQRIRKYSAIYNRFDSKTSNQVLSLHEILINEAAAAICFHRPEFLTRRDELLHLARRVLQNVGISTHFNNIQKRSMAMPTCNITAAKQIKLNMPMTKTPIRQRDSDAFRLMWRNRETKLEQIPIQIEALQCEQTKLLQQLKQNPNDSLASTENTELKKQIDDLSRQIEQLNDEEKNLKRLIRKKNMRLRAKERQQQKQQMLTNHSSMVQDLVLPIASITPSSSSAPNDISQDEATKSPIPIPSPILKARNEFSITTLIAKQIDRRREEVNETLLSSNKSTTISSTTAIEPILDSSFHSSSPSAANILPACDHERDIVESKSFIHTLNFNINT